MSTRKDIYNWMMHGFSRWISQREAASQYLESVNEDSCDWMTCGFSRWISRRETASTWNQ